MIKKHIICLLALLCTSVLSAQNLTQAKKLFEKGDFFMQDINEYIKKGLSAWLSLRPGNCLTGL